MTTEDINILFLDSALDIPYHKKSKILKECGVGSDLYNDFDKYTTQLTTILTAKEYASLERMAKGNRFDKLLEEYKKKNISIVTICSDQYPELLRQGVEPPFCLYCKGNIQLLHSVGIAVVGSRKISEYGKVVTSMFCREFVSAGLTIISGMALGVDTVAHETALEHNGATIAVLGGGFDHIYPAVNKHLFEKLCENNLVISEYPPHAEPLAYNFPVRNRIIAGLSTGVLVTEAGLKSGALHTKNYAVECGREVFAVPGRITSQESEGTNRIIKQCQSCLVLSPQDVFDSLHINLEKIEQKVDNQLDIITSTILNYISAEKKSFQEIADHTQMTTKDLNNKLIDMQMDGLIIKLAGNSYIAKH